MAKSTRRQFLKVIPATAGTYSALSSFSEPLESATPLAETRLPVLKLAAPIDRWDEAIPLGNGLTGGLLWGDGQILRLSLDRGDLWDLRIPEIELSKDYTWPTMQKLVGEKNQAEIVRIFDSPYSLPYPTKIPAGRLELTFDDARKVQSFSLDLQTAEGTVATSAGDVKVFFSAAEPVAIIRLQGPAVKWRIIAPSAVSQLGYAPVREGGDGDLRWFLQTAALGLQYAVVAGSRESRGSMEIAIAITATKDGPDPVAEGKRRVAKALGRGYAQLLPPHVEWWKRFWAQSRVQVPDPAVQLHYDEVQYFYGAASRRGAPPIPLQGVWTADEGKLPPWHGDYHHDLNTQLTYWAYLTSGHFDEGASFLDFMWNLLPEHRRFARNFFEASGAAVPGVMTLNGKPMGGWPQYSLSPTMGAWIAQSFYLHWRYTMDHRFLVERAYPYCAAIAEGLQSLLKAGPDGKLKLPLSTSPEIHNDSLKAWLTPNSNFDLSLLRWLFGVLAEMAPPAGHVADVPRWRSLGSRLDDLAVEGVDGPLRLSPDESLAESHRHLSHLMAIHPLGLLTVEGSPRDRRIINASLQQLDKLGTSRWMGYSFAWMACMAARVGDSDRALRNLRIYLDAFISRNGFHLNGDYKRKGYADAHYRPFTLEGNFAAAQAVHEMLLSSWGGVIRVFPAVSREWADVAFQNLRAEGAFSVSARRQGGRTVSVTVTANRSGRLRLRDPFEGGKVNWNRRDVSRNGSDYECTLAPGETLVGRPS